MAERRARARAQNKNIKSQKSNVCILFIKRTHRTHSYMAVHAHRTHFDDFDGKYAREM